MASINGLSLRNMKEFRGHEGEPLFQGDLLLNDIKIGFWSQDSWGGPDHVVLKPGLNCQLLNKAVHELNTDKDKHFGDGEDAFVVKYELDLLMFDYLNLAEDEKAFKDAAKEGYSGVLIASDGYRHVTWNLPLRYVQMSDDELFNALAPNIQEAKESFVKESEYDKHEVKIYRSPADFFIGKPIELQAIMQKKQGLDDRIASAKNTAEPESRPIPDASDKKKDNEPER